MSECEHRFRLCNRTLSNGTVQLGEQCEDCGAYHAVKKCTVHPSLLKEVAKYDATIREAHYSDLQEKRRAEFDEQQRERDSQQAEWWENYKTYLMSPAWMSKRQRVLERDAYVCQACLRKRASQVHHKTYAHVFQEPLFDLISVCDICHSAITQIDRARRA